MALCGHFCGFCAGKKVGTCYDFLTTVWGHLPNFYEKTILEALDFCGNVPVAQWFHALNPILLGGLSFNNGMVPQTKRMSPQIGSSFCWQGQWAYGRLFSCWKRQWSSSLLLVSDVYRLQIWADPCAASCAYTETSGFPGQ